MAPYARIIGLVWGDCDRVDFAAITSVYARRALGMHDHVSLGQSDKDCLLLVASNNAT